MALAAYDPTYGQHIKTDVEGVTVDRAFVAHYTIAAADADAASDVYILASTVLAADPTVILAKNLAAQPPTPRVLTIKGNAATVAGNVVVEGTDASGAVITETIATDKANTKIGTKAFATVTKITLPIAVDPADEISVGISDKFGLPFKLAQNTVFLMLANGSPDTVAATSHFSETTLCENYIDPTTALTGNQVDVYLLV